MFLDVIVLSIVLLAIEPVILRDKYLFLSPNIFFVAAFFIIYVSPYLIYSNTPSLSLLSRLTPAELERSVLILRYFFYSWFVCNLFFLFRIRKRSDVFLVKLKSQMNPGLLVAIILVGYFIMIVYLGIGLGFDPVRMIDRYLNPRAYTWVTITQGLGPLTYIFSAIGMVTSYYLYLSFFSRTNTWLYKGYFAFGLIGLFAGAGNKSGLLGTVVMFTTTFLKAGRYRFQYNGVKTLYKLAKIYILLALAVAALLVFSFGYHGVLAQERTRDFSVIFGRLIGYQQEAYYTARIVNDYSWKPKYLVEAFADTLLCVIPRTIWTSKGDMGYYNKYWRMKYEPDTHKYHTTTYGCLTEAHMAFGDLGPFVYGFLWSLYCYLLYVMFLTSKRYLSHCMVIYFTLYLYFYMRSGFLFYTPWSFAILFLISSVLMRKVFHLRWIVPKDRPVDISAKA